MKDVLIVAGMALAVYLLMGKKSQPRPQDAAATLIMDVGGWRYFTDGTAIGPDGAYYFQGKAVTGPNAAPLPAAWSPAPGQGNGLIPV